MSTQRPKARSILVLALLLGFLADVIVRDVSSGMNILVWTCTFLAGMVILNWRMEMPVRKGDWILMSLTIASSALLLWRDSQVLSGLTIIAMLALTGSLGISSTKSVTEAPIFEYVNAIVVSTLHVIAGGVFLFFNDLRPDAGSSGQSGPMRAALRGFALSVPLLFCFGSLFMSADAVFEHVVRSIVDFDLSTLAVHAFTIGFVTWVVAGFLRGRYIAKEVRLPENARPQFLVLGKFETCIVLGTVDLLFFLFVLVQIQYLFGGADLVGMTPGLTYAQYARRGFFELVSVAALSLPLLLVADWLYRRGKDTASPIIRLLMAFQIVLLLTIMASAVMRMMLYQSEYGLTELRLYVTAFMAWLALVFGWFAFTVLRGNRARFAFGSLSAALGVLFALYAINPEGLIAKTNMARAMEGKRFDASYIASLGHDATPTVIAGLPFVSPADRSTLAAALLKQYQCAGDLDWRSWNWSRATALRMVDNEENALRSMVASTINKEE